MLPVLVTGIGQLRGGFGQWKHAPWRPYSTHWLIYSGEFLKQWTFDIRYHHCCFSYIILAFGEEILPNALKHLSNRSDSLNGMHCGNGTYWSCILCSAMHKLTCRCDVPSAWILQSLTVHLWHISATLA